MTISTWFRSARVRRGIALSAVVLATGGLVLYRAPAAAFPGDPAPLFKPATVLVNGKNSAAFAGPGAHGMVSMSHSRVLSGTSTTVFADVRVVADADRLGADQKRAPTSLAVVLDTSGSMGGEKIDEAKRSVLRLIAEMHDDDEIAVVRYSDTSELVQPLARVGSVRSALSAKIRELDAAGGTNIPGGLSHGLRALDEAARGRVRRIVLVSDGLDNTRAQAETLARTSFSSGITVSSLGIGLDFDESYMGSLAQNGHGNFGFVKDGASLATFLHRELQETAGTTIENTRVRLQLPAGMQFVSATGADVVQNGSEIELAMGSLFAGDERRVVVELSAAAFTNVGTFDVDTQASWTQVGGGQTTVRAPRLTIVAASDASEVDRGKDGAVLASATSVVASRRQVEAANAYAQGDVRRADELARKNELDLSAAAAAAPAPAASSLQQQIVTYQAARKGFANVAPSSAEGKAAAKAGAAKDMSNLGRSVF